jgi:4-amino-4-deoxy-L-arabinose transferase-like glycosyltransferase
MGLVAKVCGLRPLAALAVLTLLVLALALPGIRTIPVTDRDEARYVQASRQMAESGDYVQIRFLEEPRNKKPAGIYWLHTLSVRLTGFQDAIWSYRLVSVAGVLMAVWLVYALARRLLPEAPLLPALALAACPLLSGVAHAATTDAMLLATVCAAQLCLARAYLGRVGEPPSLAAALGFWVALGVGILIKGPLTPLIAGLTILALCLYERDARWLRALRPALGLPLLLLIVLPWLVAIQSKTSFLQDSVGKDFLAKVKEGKESHGAPVGSYLAAAGFLFWPLFPLAWRGLGRAWQGRREDRVARFLLAWLIPSWLLFELVPTKLPHYVLPLYPVLAFLAVRGFSAPAGGGAPDGGAAGGWQGRLWQVTCRITDGVWFLAAAGLVVGPLLAARLLGWSWMPAAAVAGLVAGVAAVCAWRLRRQPAPAVLAAAGFTLLFFPLLLAAVVPRLDDFWLTRRVAAMVARAAPERPACIVSIGYTEPSVAFAFGARTVLTGGVERAVRELQQNPAALVLIQDAPAAPPRLLPVSEKTWQRWTKSLALSAKQQHRERFLAAAAAAGLRVREVAAEEGLNYSRGKRVRVILYRREDAAP